MEPEFLRLLLGHYAKAWEEWTCKNKKWEPWGSGIRHTSGSAAEVEQRHRLARDPS